MMCSITTQIQCMIGTESLALHPEYCRQRRPFASHRKSNPPLSCLSLSLFSLSNHLTFISSKYIYNNTHWIKIRIILIQSLRILRSPKWLSKRFQTFLLRNRAGEICLRADLRPLITATTTTNNNSMFFLVNNINDPPPFYSNLSQNWEGGASNMTTTNNKLLTTTSSFLWTIQTIRHHSIAIFPRTGKEAQVIWRQPITSY